MPDGTPRALGPIATATLAWVNAQRHGMQELRRPTPDELRRIELCARATLDIVHFEALYAPLEPRGHIVHRDPEDDSGYYLPEADKAVIHANYTPPPDPLEGATCDCGKPATWYMVDYSGPTIYGCEEHRHATTPEVQGQRSAPSGVPEAPEGGHGCAQPHGCCCDVCGCSC